MAKTRGNLEAAKIKAKSGGPEVDCMFNPYEYTISKTNSFKDLPNNNASNPIGEFSKAGVLTLKLELYFDTYETGEDVSKTTRKLLQLMDPPVNEERTPPEKVSPPRVIFKWATFEFEAYITNMTQKFTLFKMNGTPVRAKVDITFAQYEEPPPPQNPTSGGGDIKRAWRVVAGDRLDAIAYNAYRDATKWRAIAQRNKIRDPLALQPGQTLIIPKDGG